MLKLIFLFVSIILVIVNSAVLQEDIHPRPTPQTSSFSARALFADSSRSPEYTQEYWTTMAKDIVTAKTKPLNKNKAKNVIFFIGDGMGIQTVTAARMLLGDEKESLSFERFRHSGMVKTYCVDAQIADSACTATAYHTGVKTNFGNIGVNAKVKMLDCSVPESTHVDSIAKWAQDAKKSTGLVTTTRVTHASPAPIYAHSANRMWESDYCIPYKYCGYDLPDNNSGCKASDNIEDIAMQLVRGEVGKKLNVVLGGGGRQFHNNTVIDEVGVKGQRTDGLDLISEWKKDGKKIKKVVKKRADLLAVDASKTDYLLGLFGKGSDMNFYLDKTENEPTLWEMTEKALDVLSKNKNGFFLFVEGGRIDHGHHDNMAKHALTEAIQLSEAVEKTRARFSEDDTLIVVSADHSHVMSISGYTARGTDIFGTSTNQPYPTNMADGKNFFTLNYANGPGFAEHVESGVGRRDPDSFDTSKKEFRFPSMSPAMSESHGGEDVPVYASGPWSHLFTGTIEQNTIPHFMAYASCIGSGLKMCG